MGDESYFLDTIVSGFNCCYKTAANGHTKHEFCSYCPFLDRRMKIGELDCNKYLIHDVYIGLQEGKLKAITDSNDMMIINIVKV